MPKKAKYDVAELSDAEIHIVRTTLKLLLVSANQVQVIEYLLEACPELSEAFQAIPETARQAAFLINMYKKGVNLMCQHDFEQIYEIFVRHPKYNITIKHVSIANDGILAVLKKTFPRFNEELLEEEEDEDEDEEEEKGAAESEAMTDASMAAAWTHLQKNLIVLMEAAYATPVIDDKKMKKNRQRIFRSLTVEDIETVQSAWLTIKETPEEAGKILARLLTLQKSIVKVFHGHDINIATQADVIFGMLDTALNKMSDIDNVIPWLKKLGVKHMEMHVGPKLLAIMKPILLTLFKDCLGFGFTDAVRESWQRVSGFLIGMMIEGCRQADRGSVASSLCEDGDDVGSVANMLSTEDIDICQDTWNLVQKVIDKAVNSFYKDLISSKAEIRNLFSQSNMQEQAMKLVRAIGGVVNLLQEGDELVAILEELGRRHVYYKVLPRHFKYLKLAWFRMLETALTLRWTPKVKTAWQHAWMHITSIMKTSLEDALLLYTPPDPEKVRLKVLINHIDRITTQDMSFYGDVWYAAYTCDNPSQSSAFGLDSKDPNIDASLGYQPRTRPPWNLVPLNGMEVEEQYRANRQQFLRKYEDTMDDNNAKWYMRGQLRGTFSQPFDLHSFPFDHHVLRLNFSLQVDATVAVFDEDNLSCRLMPFKVDTMAGTDWDVMSPRIFMHQDSAIDGGSASGKRYNHCRVEIPITRKYKHHIWETFLPLFLIETFAWSVYFADIHPMAKRMGVVTTLLLTLFAFKWTVQESMPPTPYLTLMDNFFNVAKLLLLLHIVGQVVIITWEEIEILNFAIAAGLFVLFIVIHTVLFFRINTLIKRMPKKQEQSALAVVAKTAKSIVNKSMMSENKSMMNSGSNFIQMD